MPNPKPGPPVVLLVDDSPDVRLSLRLMLETEEFQVVDAESGPAALALLEQLKKVDVVLTDLYMPGVPDGVGLTQAIRRRPKPHPAIIAMSGSPHLAYRSSLQAARYVGADATLTKPFTGTDLITAIRGVLGSGPKLSNKRPDELT